MARVLGSPDLVPPCADLAPQCGPIGHRSQVRLSLLSVGWASAMEELALSFLRLDQQLQLILATTSPNDVCVFHIVPETRVTLASIRGITYSEDAFHLYKDLVDHVRVPIGYFAAWSSRETML